MARSMAIVEVMFGELMLPTSDADTGRGAEVLRLASGGEEERR